MAKSVKFAYWGASGVRGQYTRNANAWQKIRLSVEQLGAELLIPQGGRGTVPEEFASYGKIVELRMPTLLRWVCRGKFRSIANLFVSARWCRTHGCTLLMSVSNEVTLLGAMIATGLVPVWMFCWDPPGVSVRNRHDLLSRFRCRLMDGLMKCAIRRSQGLVLNLHGGFADAFLQDVRSRIHVFVNGTDLEYNRTCIEGVAHVPYRLAVNSAFSEAKGCWEYVELFERLWRDNNEASLVWIGQGDSDRVRARFLADGIPSSALRLGKFPLEESLRLLASASVAVCLYPDLPSWRWNFILKAPEFLSMGIPLVAYRLPGLATYIVEGVTGCLLSPHDFEGVVTTVRGLVGDPARLDVMQWEAVRRSVEYDWGRINTDIAHLLLGASSGAC